MNRIRDLRREKNVTMREVAEDLEIPYTTYVNYEKGTREPKHEMLATLANYFGVSSDYLIGRTSVRAVGEEFDIFSIPGILPMPRTRRIPILGTIACGVPILASQNIEDYIETPDGINADFALKCKGDSMVDARINDGDIVFIRSQEQVENGEIAAVLIDGEATLKKFYVNLKTKRVTLQAANSSYEPIIYVGEETAQIRILGKAVAFLSLI